MNSTTGARRGMKCMLGLTAASMMLLGGCGSDEDAGPDEMAKSLMRDASLNEKQAICTSELLQGAGFSDERLDAITSGKGAFEDLNAEETAIMESINTERAECLSGSI